MRRIRKRAGFRAPTLVPLADMLCNTLGIVIFILVFTVLTTGNATTHTSFPIEQESSLGRVLLICCGNRVCPIDAASADFHRTVQRGVTDQLLNWKYDDRYCSASFDFDRMITKYEAKPENGDAPSDVEAKGSAFQTLLAKESPKKKFVFFFVYPDSGDAYGSASKAARELGFRTGWSPCSSGEPIMLGGRGGGIPLNHQ